MPPILSLRHYNHDQIDHSHGHAQLVFGLRGQLEFEMDGHGCRIGPQLLAVVPSDTRHACDSRDGSRCLIVDVPGGDWLSRRLGHHLDSGRRLLDRPSALRLTPAQSQLVGWLAAGPINDPVIDEQGAALLLSSLATGCEPLGPVRELPLSAIRSYVERHLAYPLQVKDLARLAGLSVPRFHARFLDETGLTPLEFVRHLRLQRGRELLASSPMSVAQIAARVGYASQSAFTAALRRESGVTPRALRRESLDDPRY